MNKSTYEADRDSLSEAKGLYLIKSEILRLLALHQHGAVQVSLRMTLRKASE